MTNKKTKKNTQRLDKFVSSMTLYSRSDVKMLIKKSAIYVNGSLAKKPNMSVDVNEDIVEVDGQEIMYEPFVYFVMNKPDGVISATEDNRWETVIDLLPEDTVLTYEPFPIGRLDKDTTGLLLITNDGQFNHAIMAPKKHVEKEYAVLVDGLLTDKNIGQFEKGLDIGKGEITKPAKLFIDQVDEKMGQTFARVVIAEGKYHQVKRMFHAVGCEVVQLHRQRIGQLTLPDILAAGDFVQVDYQDLYDAVFEGKYLDINA
ncbi:pseudouridine synthase [Aerococcaceae bacterium 50-4]